MTGTTALALVERPSDAALSTSLTAAERDALTAFEVVIETGQEVFQQVGSALLAIRDRRLYRETHRTFEAYLDERWGFSRQRAHQLIEAAGVVQSLASTTVDVSQINERQARVLAPLSQEEQRVIFTVAKGTAPDGKVTAAHLKALVAILGDIVRLNAIDDGTGVMVPWADLPAARKAALFEINVIEDVFERHQRRREQIRGFVGSSDSFEWYSPAVIVEAAREVLGAIDLDPASCALANETIRAAVYYTNQDDGLQHDWPGRVFLNPPYCRKAGAFVKHLLDQHARGITTAAIVLVNSNANSDLWFQPLFDHLLCFARRVDFVSPTGAAGGRPSNGTIVAYLGPERERFVRVFSAFGRVLCTCDSSAIPTETWGPRNDPTL